MFDSQKLSFQDFAIGYKHGIYVLLNTDACEICVKYKRTIEHINNGNLYFVEVNTQRDRDLVYKMTQRAAFPMTCCYWDNELEYVRLGQLFELQLKEIYASLEKFGPKPLTELEKRRRMQELKAKCEPAYYIFPPDIDADSREKLTYNAVNHAELPIDVERICPNLPEDKRYRLFEGSFRLAKLVIFKDENTNIYSDFAQRLMTGYMSKVKDASFVIRNIKEELNASDNPDKQEN